MRKFLKLLKQSSLAGRKARFQLKFMLFSVVILAFMAISLFVLRPEIGAFLVATAPVVAIVKGGNPKKEEDLTQEEKDTLATIQKTINDAFAAFDIKSATPEQVEKYIDDIVGESLDELKSKDKNGKFSVAIKELTTYKNIVTELAKKVDKIEKGNSGIEFGKKTGIAKIVDGILESEKFKEFAAGNAKRSGKIRFETKTISLTGDYNGDKLITRQSDIVSEHPQPRKLNMRDVMMVDQGDDNMPSITFTQITDLDRNAAVETENGMLQESAYKVKEVTESVKRLGTVLFVSKRMLKSLRWLRSWLTNRIPTWVKLTEDFQILKGDGTGENFNGLMNQCPDFKDVLSDSFITGAAGSIKSVSSYKNGTQTIVEFADPQPLINNGMRITFSGFTNSAYNASFIVNKENDRRIMIEVAYTAESDTSAASFTSGGEFAGTVENPDEVDVVRAARAYLTYGEYTPNAISLNPIDVFRMQSLKDTTGRDLEKVRIVNGITYINGLPVVETTAVVAGEFVLGDWINGASLVDFTALEVEFAEDVETKRSNQVAIIVQEETIMPVYNPYAFLKGKFSEILPLISKV